MRIGYNKNIINTLIKNAIDTNNVNINNAVKSLNEKTTNIYIKSRQAFNYTAKGNQITELNYTVQNMSGYTPVLCNIEYTSSDFVTCTAVGFFSGNNVRVYLKNTKTEQVSVSNGLGLVILYMKNI